MAEARRCGDCRVCCATFHVAAVSKPAWTPCPHECASGCAIYTDRPEVCRGYECLWLAGELPDWAHPLRAGVLASRPDPGSAVVTILEVTDGAAASYWGERVVRLLARRNLVQLLCRDGRLAQVTAAANRVRVGA